MATLLLSDGGLLSRALVARAGMAGVALKEVRIAETGPLDVAQLATMVSPEIRLLVNAVNMFDPRHSEQAPALSRELNHDWQRRVAELCVERQIALIAYSSCYVFDGLKQTHYIASNPGKPVGHLGRDLWEFEQWLRTHLPQHVILRLGWRTDVLFQWLLDGLRSESPLAFSSGLRGSPVTVFDVARVTIAMIQQLECGAELWGTFQYAGAETVTQFDLVMALSAALEEAGMAGVRERVIDGDTVNRLVEPVNTTLGCTKIKNTFGVKQLPWRPQLLAEAKAVIKCNAS